VPVEPHGQSYARKILRAFPEGSAERAIADANVACRRKGSRARCGLPFCRTCGNAAIQQRQLYVTSRMANHPDRFVFAVTVLADAVPSVLGSDLDVSRALAEVEVLKAKLRRAVASGGVKDFWLYGAVEYEVRHQDRYSRFVRDCLGERQATALPPFVIVPHVHLIMAARWPNRTYLTRDQLARVFTGGGAVASRNDRNFHRPEQVLVQPLRRSVVEDVPRLVDYGMKFRLRGRPGPTQAYYPPEVVRELALLFNAAGQTSFFIDIESQPMKPVAVLPPSARKSPLLLTLHRERLERGSGAFGGNAWDPETGEVWPTAATCCPRGPLPTSCVLPPCGWNRAACPFTAAGAWHAPAWERPEGLARPGLRCLKVEAAARGPPCSPPRALVNPWTVSVGKLHAAMAAAGRSFLAPPRVPWRGHACPGATRSIRQPPAPGGLPAR